MNLFSGYQFKIGNLSRLDEKKLNDLLKATDARIAEPTRKKGAHHELATVAVIGGIAIISVIANYMFGKTKSDRLAMIVEVIAPNGEVRRLQLDLNRKEVEPVDNQILGQIKSFIGEKNE
jgi:hypothetical protein